MGISFLFERKGKMKRNDMKALSYKNVFKTNRVDLLLKINRYFALKQIQKIDKMTKNEDFTIGY